MPGVRTKVPVLAWLFVASSLSTGAADLPATNGAPEALQHPRLTVERHLTLAPKPGNRRNSEGDFIRLKDGRWLFIYTHFTDGANDHSKAFLASRESSDDGRTWTGED